MDKKTKKVDESLVEYGPVTDSGVMQRGLVSESVSIKQIVENHKSFNIDTTKNRNFNSPVLAYVTPWNNRGYDIVKMFHKFTLVAPVWFQLVPDQSNSNGNKITLKINGQHDVDKGWIDEVKATGAKIVPRVIFEGFDPKILKQIMRTETLAKVR